MNVMNSSDVCQQTILLKYSLNWMVLRGMILFKSWLSRNLRQSPMLYGVTTALKVNALSSWALINRFEAIAESNPLESGRRELWVNTSEAEIQPALSPGYELSKRLIGQLVSLRWSQRRTKDQAAPHLRKLVLGPFKSDLNPIGLMSADLVAQQVLIQASWGLSLIIVTPNPLTYLLMPLNELGRSLYNRCFSRPDP